MKARFWGAPLVALLFAGLVTAAPQDPPADPVDVIDALLASFASFRDVSPAELQREVAEVGGIAFRSEVPLDFMPKADLVRYLREVLDSEYPAERALAEQRTLVALGLLPADLDLRAARARLLEENVVGFYDERPGRKRLYAVSEHKRLTPANQIILSHELRHALQDQYMDLHQALPASVGDFDDRRLALMSLIEGDATLVMERFLARRLGIEGGGLDIGAMTLPAAMGMPDAPPVLRDQLVLPYLMGRQFAFALWQKGGWAAVRAAWERPPSTTEQVLHPDKFLSREEARTPPDLPPAPRGGRPLLEGVVGEMLTRTLLGEGQDAAAAGWGGDRFQGWDVGGRTLLFWRSVWDSDADRREFRDALTAAFARHGAGAPRGRFKVFTNGRWRHALAEDGASVLLVSGDDPAAVLAALDALSRAR